MEQLAVLANGKCRRRYSPEHALFAAGNALRALKYYQEGGCGCLPLIVVASTCNRSSHFLEDKEEECDADVANTFQCRLLTCNVGFRSVAAFEEHYDLKQHGENPAHKQQEGEKKKKKKKKKRPRKKKDRVQMEAKPASNQMEIDEAAAPEFANPPKKTDAQHAHSESGTHDGGVETKDVEMVDELAESMKNLRIPKNLTFGRRGRRWV
ncbi:hypothetical protein FI667_g3412, partial [Globisporangium splendens]